jgi:hypothetical protein
MDFQFVLTIAGAAVGAYVAISSKLASLQAKVEQAAKDCEKAHERLDDHINLLHTHRSK